MTVCFPSLNYFIPSEIWFGAHTSQNSHHLGYSFAAQGYDLLNSVHHDDHHQSLG